jgi:hypothetical protein
MAALREAKRTFNAFGPDERREGLGNYASLAATQERQASRERLDHDLVHVAPSPVLTSLIGAHDRVAGLVEVLRGVFVLGGIAARHMPALHAQAKMDPRISGFYTVFTHVLVGGCDFDLIEVRAFSGHEVLLS